VGYGSKRGARPGSKKNQDISPRKPIEKKVSVRKDSTKDPIHHSLYTKTVREANRKENLTQVRGDELSRCFVIIIARATQRGGDKN